MFDSPLRVGRIAYTNVAPVETAFDLGAVVRSAVLTSAAPTTLNAALTRGDLDVSPVSAAHFVRHRDDLELFGDVGIVSRGPVISVLLVSPKPPALLGGASIAVSGESASGRALLEALLHGRYGVNATFEAVADAPREALRGRPTLLIGDAAIGIRARVRAQSIHDLGTAWFAWTGLPMVFAVWAVRRDVVRARPDDIARLREAYLAARRWGRANPDAVVSAAMQQRPHSREFYEAYFTTLRYQLDVDACAGLDRFENELRALETVHVAR